jgi:hypothetical protein
MARASKIVELRTLTLRVPMAKSGGSVQTNVEFIHEASHPDLQQGSISLLNVEPSTDVVWRNEYIDEYTKGLSEKLESTFSHKFKVQYLIDFSPQNIRQELLRSIKFRYQ